MKREELELKRKAKQGEIEAARLELANLELERQQAVIRAPIDGVVTAGDVKVGDLLEPGKPAVGDRAAGGVPLRGGRSPARRSATCGSGCRRGSSWTPTTYQRYGTLDGTVSFISPDSGVGGTGQRRLHREDRDEPGRDRARGVPRPGQAGDGRAGEIVTGRETPVAPGEADPPDDQPRLRPA